MIPAPGQTPSMPQPTPNTTDPASNLRSISFRVGRCHSPPSSGVGILRYDLQIRKFGRQPNIASNARLGSQCRPPSRTIRRNPIGFDGLAIPVTIMPSPKRNPLQRETIALLIRGEEAGRNLVANETRYVPPRRYKSVCSSELVGYWGV